METITLERPPKELLQYKFVRKKLLWGLKKLDKSISPEKQQLLKSLEQTLENHITVLGRRREEFSLVKRIFNAELTVQPSDSDHLSEKDEASSSPQTSRLLNHRFIIFLVESSGHGDMIDLGNESKALLTTLPTSMSEEIIARIVFFVDNSTAHEIEILRMKIRTTVNLGQDITLIPIDGSVSKIRDSLHTRISTITDVITGTLLSEKPHRTSWAKEHVQLNEICENVKRLVAVPQKQNIVNDDLRDLFQSAKANGYSGHVFLDGRLSIYHRTDANMNAMGALHTAASQLFDVVELCVIPGDVRPFTDLRHDERGTNEAGQAGTLEALARMQPENQIAAISVAHFVGKGDKIKIHQNEIGECIWPVKSANDCCLNDISVIKLKSIYSNQSVLLHENMAMQKLPFVIDPNFPPAFSEVFKGRNDVGFVTGTITSIEASLPYKGQFVTACLVDGDDDIPFAKKGDSGAVIKLQEETGNQLHGFAVVFGGAFRFPNIPEDTCIGILITPSLHRFQQDTSSTLTFN